MNILNSNPEYPPLGVHTWWIQIAQGKSSLLTLGPKVGILSNIHLDRKGYAFCRLARQWTAVSALVPKAGHSQPGAQDPSNYLRQILGSQERSVPMNQSKDNISGRGTPNLEICSATV